MTDDVGNGAEVALHLVGRPGVVLVLDIAGELFILVRRTVLAEYPEVQVVEEDDGTGGTARNRQDVLRHFAVDFAAELGRRAEIGDIRV